MKKIIKIAYNLTFALFIMFFYSIAGQSSLAQDKNLEIILERNILDMKLNSFENQNEFNVFGETQSQKYCIELAGGIKYHPIGNENEKEISQCWIGSFMLKLNPNSFWGIETKYYKHGQDSKKYIKNVVLFTPFYQWNPKILYQMHFLAQIGITIYSNNSALFFTNSIDFGLNYKFDGIGIFVKNSVNINYIPLSNTLSTFNLGVKISL